MARQQPGILLSVALGAAVGGPARAGIVLAIPARPGQFPWAVLLVNVLGSLLIGVARCLAPLGARRGTCAGGRGDGILRRIHDLVDLLSRHRRADRARPDVDLAGLPGVERRRRSGGSGGRVERDQVGHFAARSEGGVSTAAWLLVSLGTAVGALARYFTDAWVQQLAIRRYGLGRISRFPTGILLINVLGSFVLGLLTEIASHGLGPQMTAFAATGICGGYTTFSTWAFDTLRLAGDGDRSLALVNVGLSVGGGMLAAAAGLGIALL